MPYIVMHSVAKMPASVRHPYKRVAVVEVDTISIKPKMISTRARGVKRIVETWERCNVGKAINSAYARAMENAGVLAADLNAQEKRGEVMRYA